MLLTRIALGCALALGPMRAQDAFLDWMNRVAQERLARREAALSRISAPAGAQRRSRWVRNRLLEILDGLPDYRGPLNTRVTGQLTNRHYTLEKVIFESLPKYYITANLYRPNEPGRYPAVLLSSGHHAMGKVDVHRIAANRAAKGFVVLGYDPLGLGERVQAYDPCRRCGYAGCCANEHLQAGAQSLLIGQSVARYFIWDAMRGIDCLVSRPEVDPGRIGAAGCSGGGCVTTYIGALDPRVKAAAPGCYLNSLRILFAGPFLDAEMSLPRLVASGLDHADFLEASDGKPWLILTTKEDYFIPFGVYPVYEEVRRWYAIDGAEDKVRMFLGPGPHGTPLETREAFYAWLIEWLRPGEQVDAREMDDITLYADRELQVTESGQVEYEEGSPWPYQVIREEWKARRTPGKARALAGLRRQIVPATRGTPVHTVAESSPGGFSLSLESEPAVNVSGLVGKTVPALDGFRYRTAGQTDNDFLTELLQ